MTSLPLSASLKRSLASAAKAYHAQLAEDEQALAHLEARGLSGPASEVLQLGVVRSPRPEHSRMQGRLAIPYIGPRGNVYDIRFRCITDHDCKEVACPKYLGSDGVETRPYNVRDLLAPTDYIFITEGEMDAASLVACGWPAVGIPGANGWKPHYKRLFAGFPKVVVIADGDEAGRGFAKKVTAALSPACHTMLAPEGEDVNSLLVKRGRDGLAAFLKGSTDDE